MIRRIEGVVRVLITLALVGAYGHSVLVFSGITL